MVESIEIFHSKNSNAVSKAKRYHYLEECAKLILKNKALRLPYKAGQKLTYAEAEQMRKIYREWNIAYLNCETNKIPNLHELGRRFGIDDATSYRILKYMRYYEDNDITYERLKLLGFIKEDE